METVVLPGRNNALHNKPHLTIPYGAPSKPHTGCQIADPSRLRGRKTALSQKKKKDGKKKKRKKNRNWVAFISLLMWRKARECLDTAR